MSVPDIKHTLSDYPQLSITAYHKHLQGKEAHSVAMSYQYNGKAYGYNIELSKTQCNYGGYVISGHTLNATILGSDSIDLCKQLESVKALKRLGLRHGAYQLKSKGSHRATHKWLFLEYIDIENNPLK